MYYEERVVNGVLMFRTAPESDWRQCSIEKMSQRIVEMDALAKALSRGGATNAGTLTDNAGGQP